MDLWIRSQSKLGLYKVDEVYIDKRDFGNNDIQHYIMTNGVTLGIYKSKERALEVLDEIQNILRPTQLMINNGGAFVSNDNNLHIINPTYSKIEQLDPIIYEMPNE